MPGSSAEFSAGTTPDVRAFLAVLGAPRPADGPPAPATTGDPAAPHIVIVDDEPINIKVVQKYLKLAGYERFSTTTDSTRALELIQESRPDLVLLDIMMPRVSGLDILERLHADQAFEDLPVIVLTASADRETRLNALRLGANEFLTKPVDAVELEVRCRNVLRAKAHRDQLKDYAWDLERQVAARTLELAWSHLEVVECLARVGEFRDNDTGRHVVRVGRYAEAVARRLGCDGGFVERLRLAAPLHDIGKVCIPDAILLKPGRLDALEFNEINRHCGFGNDICCTGGGGNAPNVESHTLAGRAITGAGSSPVLRMAATIAYTHHEKWDGSGYPQGLSGEEIPLEGRITAVADVFDALTSVRPYKRAMPLEEAIRSIEDGRGKHFDPAVIDAFLAGIDEIVRILRECADDAPSAETPVG